MDLSKMELTAAPDSEAPTLAEGTPPIGTVAAADGSDDPETKMDID